MAAVTLLHLTDLHFGCDQDNTQVVERQLVLDSLVEHVGAQTGDWRPQIVCVSGDIGWKGKASDYLLARVWLKQLLDRLELNFSDVVVCAGNHDANREITGRLGRPRGDVEADELLRVPIAEHNLNAFQAYSEFCRDAGIAHYTFQDKPSHLLGHATLKGVRFAACNSSWFCKGNDDKGNLWLGLPLIRIVEAEGGLRLSPNADDGPVVCLIHHPPDWWHESETNAYGPRPNTRDYIAARCHVLLTGHTHGEVRKADRIAQAALHLTGGAGYSGASHYNSYRLMRFTQTRIRHRSFEYDPRSSESKWRDHGVNDLPFVEGPPETVQVARGSTLNPSNVAALRDASRAAAAALVKDKSRQIKPRGALPVLQTFQVQLRVTEQTDRYGPGGEFQLDREQLVALPLEEACCRARRTVLLGDLGSGKSTLAGSLVSHALDSSPSLLAFLFPVRGLRLDDQFSLIELLTACDRFIREQIAPKADAIDLKEALDAEHSVTCAFDGLDEVPRARAARLLRQLAALSDQWPTASVLVTGRPVELSGVSYESWGVCRVPPLGDSDRLVLFASEARAEGLDGAQAEGEATRRLERLRQHPTLHEIATTPLTTRLVWPRLAVSSVSDLSLGDLMHELLVERLGGWDSRNERISSASDFATHFPTSVDKAEMLGELALCRFKTPNLGPEAAETALVERWGISRTVAAQALQYFEESGVLSANETDLDFQSQPLQESAASYALLSSEAPSLAWTDGAYPFRCFQFAAALARRRMALDKHREALKTRVQALLQHAEGILGACFIAAESRDTDIARTVVAAFAHHGHRPLPGVDRARGGGYHAIAHTLWLAGHEGWEWFHREYLDARYPIINTGGAILEEVFRHWSWFAKGALTSGQRDALYAHVRPVHVVGGLFSVLPCLAVLIPDAFTERERLWYISELLDSDLFGEIAVQQIREVAPYAEKDLVQTVLSRRSKHDPRAALLYEELFRVAPATAATRSLLRRWAIHPEDAATRSALGRMIANLGETAWQRYLRWCLSDPDGHVAIGAALRLLEMGEKRLAILGNALARGLRDGSHVQRAERELAALLETDRRTGCRWVAQRIGESQGLAGASSALWRLFLELLDPEDEGSPPFLCRCLKDIGPFVLARYPDVRDAFRRLLVGAHGPSFHDSLVRGLGASRSDIRHGCAAVLVATTPASEAEALTVLVYDRDEHDDWLRDWELFLLGLSHGPSALAVLRQRLPLFHTRGRALALALLYRAKVPLRKTEKEELFAHLLQSGNSHLVDEAVLLGSTDRADWKSALEQAQRSPNADVSKRASEVLLHHFAESIAPQVLERCRANAASGHTHVSNNLRQELLRVLDEPEHRIAIRSTLDEVRTATGRTSILEHVIAAVDAPPRWKEVIWSVLYERVFFDVEDSGKLLVEIGLDRTTYAPHIGAAAVALLDDPRTDGEYRGEERLWLALLAHEFGEASQQVIVREVLKANVHHGGVLRALLARLGRIPTGFVPPDLWSTQFPTELGQKELPQPNGGALSTVILDYARVAERMHPATGEALDEFLFANSPDEEWLHECAGRGQVGEMIAETIRFCASEPPCLTNFGNMARRPHVHPTVAADETFKRLHELVSITRDSYLLQGTVERENYALELRRVLTSEEHWIAFVATELLAVTQNVPDEVVDQILEDFSSHYTESDAALATRLVDLFVSTSEPQQPRVASLRRALPLLDGREDATMRVASPYAQLFVPLALWNAERQADAVSVRVYLRGLRRVFSHTVDQPKPPHGGFSVLEIFSPLIEHVPHEVWLRVRGGDELKCDLITRSLALSVKRFFGE